MKKITELFHPAIQLARGLTGLGNSRHYILINDSGIFYLLLGGKSGHLAISTLYSEYPDFKDCLDKFIINLKKHPLFMGQPVTILMGGSKCFHHIEQIKTKDKFNPSKKFSWLNTESAIIRFRIYRTRGGNKCAYYGGIESDTYNRITRRLHDEGLTIKDFRPATLFIFEKWLKKDESNSLAVKLPGQIIRVFLSGDRISILDENLNAGYVVEFTPDKLNIVGKTIYYSFFSQDITGDNHNTRPLYNLIKGKIWDTHKEKFFWSPATGNKRMAMVWHVANGLRLSALILVCLSLLLLITSLTMRLWRSTYSSDLAAYQTEYEQKTQLMTEIADLESKLDATPVSNYNMTSISAAISTFCQRRPYGLYLSEINAYHDNEDNWRVTATGLAEKESAVFSYRDYISQNTMGRPLEVTALQKTNTGRRSTNANQAISYGFKIRLELGDNR